MPILLGWRWECRGVRARMPLEDICTAPSEREMPSRIYSGGIIHSQSCPVCGDKTKTIPENPLHMSRRARRPLLNSQIRYQCCEWSPSALAALPRWPKRLSWESRWCREEGEAHGRGRGWKFHLYYGTDYKSKLINPGRGCRVTGMWDPIGESSISIIPLTSNSCFLNSLCFGRINYKHRVTIRAKPLKSNSVPQWVKKKQHQLHLENPELYFPVF